MKALQVAYSTSVGLGEEIDRELEVRGWTQRELADRMGVPHGYVSRWIKGVVPDGDNIRLLAEILERPDFLQLRAEAQKRDGRRGRRDRPVNDPTAAALEELAEQASDALGRGERGTARGRGGSAKRRQV